MSINICKYSTYVQIFVMKWHLWCSVQKCSKQIILNPMLATCLFFTHRAQQMAFHHETLHICKTLDMFAAIFLSRCFKVFFSHQIVGHSQIVKSPKNLHVHTSSHYLHLEKFCCDFLRSWRVWTMVKSVLSCQNVRSYLFHLFTCNGNSTLKLYNYKFLLKWRRRFAQTRWLSSDW